MKKRNKHRTPSPKSAPPHHPLGLVEALPAPVGAVLHSRATRVLEGAFIVGAVVLWGAFATLVFRTAATTLQPEPAVASSVTLLPKATGQPRTLRHLDGVTVSPGAENHWPIGVMVENAPAARPQAGLGSAKVVIEAPAESGVTRFLALYDGSEDAVKVGPVRSARHYYVSWSLGWWGVYVHAGGSPQATAFFRRTETNEAEALGSMAKFFYRDRSRAAPHNLYTDMERLRSLRRVKELEERVPTYVPWTHRDAPPLEERGTPTGPIVVGFAGASYRVVWTYDREGNRYLRENGGRPHIDANTGAQIAATNVVVVRVGGVKFLGEKGRIDFPTVGSGAATVFANGTVTEGTWSKPGDRDMLRFTGPEGAEIALTPGSTWIEIVVPGESVTF